jgi:hypothetical protein
MVLKNKDFREENMTKVGLYAIGTSTTLESNKSHAKNQARLQERLDVYWIVHNFVRVHFTTRQVPAVALGILEHGFALHEIFLIQKAA